MSDKQRTLATEPACLTGAPPKPTPLQVLQALENAWPTVVGEGEIVVDKLGPSRYEVLNEHAGWRLIYSGPDLMVDESGAAAWVVRHTGVIAVLRKHVSDSALNEADADLQNDGLTVIHVGPAVKTGIVGVIVNPNTHRLCHPSATFWSTDPELQQKMRLLDEACSRYDAAGVELDSLFLELQTELRRQEADEEDEG